MLSTDVGKRGIAVRNFLGRRGTDRKFPVGPPNSIFLTNPDYELALLFKLFYVGRFQQARRPVALFYSDTTKRTLYLFRFQATTIVVA